MLQQEFGYGCGMYAVANALNLSSFATDERLEASKNGNNIGQLTKWLIDDSHDIWIDTIKYSGKLITLPKLTWKLDESVAYYPMLLSKQATKTKNHMIALKCYPDGSVGVWDSLEDMPYLLGDWDRVRKFFPKVYSLFSFKNFENKEIFMLK